MDFLPSLTDEEKDDITYNEKNYTTERGLKTLIEKLEEYEDGFKMFVHALQRADLGHVAVLLDPECTGKIEKNALIHTLLLFTFYLILRLRGTKQPR